MDPFSTSPVKLVQAFLRMVLSPFLDSAYRPGTMSIVDRIRAEGRVATSRYGNIANAMMGPPRWMERGPGYPAPLTMARYSSRISQTVYQPHPRDTTSTRPRPTCEGRPSFDAISLKFQFGFLENHPNLPRERARLRTPSPTSDRPSVHRVLGFSTKSEHCSTP